jgi:hypothetical protein
MHHDDIVTETRYNLIDTPGVTLDGEPATISGAQLRFAMVRSRSGKSAEFAWPTVARVVHKSGGAFRL